MDPMGIRCSISPVVCLFHFMVYISYLLKFWQFTVDKGEKSGNKEGQLEVKDFQIENNGCNQKSVIHLSVALQVFFVSTTTSESQITKMPACQKRTCPFEHLGDVRS